MRNQAKLVYETVGYWLDTPHSAPPAAVHASSGLDAQLRLQARIDFGSREILGIERIHVDDPRHVDRHFVGIGRNEERDQLARHVDERVVPCPLPKGVETRNRRQRLGDALLRPQRRAHLLRMLANVLRQRAKVDVAEPEHQRRGLHASAFVALLLAGCSQAGTSGSVPSSEAPAHAPANAAAPAGPASGSSSASQAARLALASPNIIYTASLTIRAANVTAAASRATGIVLREGGYVSSEQATIDPADHARSTVSLQLKIPVAAYGTTLATLSAVLGTQTSLTQHAQDVTQQVADVSSLVTSAQDAITQLQALLKRAGSVSDLLSVQEQINAQESSLEALQAQQRALARETSYATVSVTLVSTHRAPARQPHLCHPFSTSMT